MLRRFVSCGSFAAHRGSASQFATMAHASLATSCFWSSNSSTNTHAVGPAHDVLKSIQESLSSLVEGQKVLVKDVGQLKTDVGQLKTDVGQLKRGMAHNVEVEIRGRLSELMPSIIPPTVQFAVRGTRGTSLPDVISHITSRSNLNLQEKRRIVDRGFQLAAANLPTTPLHDDASGGRAGRCAGACGAVHNRR